MSVSNWNRNRNDPLEIRKAVAIGELTTEQGIGLCEAYRDEEKRRALEQEEIEKRNRQGMSAADIAEREASGNMMIERSTKRIQEYEAAISYLLLDASKKINVRGGLKELAAILLELESNGRIDHVTDKQAAELFTVNGAPVNPNSLKSIRCRDLGTAL